MREEFRPAIDALEKDLQEATQKVLEIKRAINTLSRHAGGQPRYPDADGDDQTANAAIRRDAFYGKRLMTAMREYLEMRRHVGPATPREIYEALREGGYSFGGQESNAISAVRAALRKNSTTFHRLPGGDNAYGLLKWYPKARKPVAGSDQDDDNGATEGAYMDDSDDSVEVEETAATGDNE